MKILIPDKIEDSTIDLSWNFKNRVLYGPAISKRFGLSIGINLYPKEKKCNFDCGYCCAGPTNKEAKDFLQAPRIKERMDKEISEYLKKNLIKKIDSIAFCGNGEPIIHPQFAEICRYFRNKVLPQLKQRNPQIRSGIITNLSVYDRDKYKEIRKLDEIYVKLDGIKNETFKKICRPNTKSPEDIIENLKRLDTKFRVSTGVVHKSPDFSNIVDLLTEYPKTLKNMEKCTGIFLHNINPPTPIKGIKRLGLSCLKIIGSIVEQKSKKPVYILWETEKEAQSKKKKGKPFYQGEL